jgi:hypothetical protein
VWLIPLCIFLGVLAVFLIEEPEVTDWQPIETAPDKSGPVLLYIPGTRGVTWPPYMIVGFRLPNGDWWTDESSEPFSAACQPSHWAPLPEPPTT